MKGFYVSPALPRKPVYYVETPRRIISPLTLDEHSSRKFMEFCLNAVNFM